MANDIAIERKHKRKSANTSLVVHIVILLIAFFSTCNYEKAVENQYAVAVNFQEVEFKPSSNSNNATSTSGAAKKKADPVSEIEQKKAEPLESKVPDIKVPKPTPVPPTPTDPVITEEPVEESDLEAVEEIIEIDEPEIEPVPDPVPDPEPEVVQEDPAPKEIPKESTKDRISRILDVFKSGGGKKTDNPEGPPSRNDGNDEGTGEGKTGTGQGKDKTGDDGDSGVGTGGAGVGEYDDSGDGVFGRKVIYRNYSKIPMTTSGKVAVKVCINRTGNVTYAELLERESTISDTNILKKTLEAARGYRFEPDLTAPKEQCGKLTIILDINAFKITEG